MNLVLLLEAEAEATEAAMWYEKQRTGLGREFLDDLETTFQNLVANAAGLPFLESSESTDPLFQRASLKRFPYLVVFTIREEDIVVVAIAHARRKPGYWKNRIS